MKVRTKGEIVLRILSGIVLLLSLTSMTASCNHPEKSAGPKEKVTIGVGSGGQSFPVMIAREKGFFTEEGLDATIKLYPSGKKAMEAMFAGEVDMATAADTPIVLNSLLRDDFSLFVVFASSYDNSKIIGRKDRGVVRPEDLRGKKIGMVYGTSIHFYVHIYLAEQEIDPAAVKLVNLAPTELSGALKDGRIDAAATWEPYGYESIKALPGTAVRLPASKLYKETASMTVMKSFAKRHPEALKKVLRALDRGITFMSQKRSESMAIINTSLKLEEAFLAATWDDFEFKLSLDQSMLTLLEDQARWAMKSGFTDKTKSPNYLGYINLDALKAIKPEAVTMIQQAVTE